MARHPSGDSKHAALKAHGALNPHPEAVSDPLFQGSEFFDPRDRAQVKYEMLRRVKEEGQAVSRAAEDFGVSRPTYYEAQAAFDRQGLAGLLPRKRGPRGGHKLTQEVMDFVATRQEEDPSLGVKDLVRLIHEHFAIRVHPRSVERAFQRRKKRRNRG